jgi:hypothetical protein
MYTALVGDGSLMPFFATTHERVGESIDKEVDGYVCFLPLQAPERGIRGACEWGALHDAQATTQAWRATAH